MSRDTHADVKVTFEAIPVESIDKFEELTKLIGELIGTEMIDFGIYESYDMSEK